MELTGVSISPGIAIGSLYIYHPYDPAVIMESISESMVDDAIKCYFNARDAAKDELEQIRSRMVTEEEDKSQIVEAHLEILYDEAIAEEIEDLIRNDFYTAMYAVDHTYDRFSKQLEKAKDPLIAERSSDVQDVKRRILRCMEGLPEKSLSALEEPVIVVAHELLPSDTASMDKENVLGIMTEVGGTTSHTAIIAKEYGIPAISGVKDLMEQVSDGLLAIVDGQKGMAVIDPDGSILSQYRVKQQEHRQREQLLRRYCGRAAVTKDGTHIDIGLNIGSDDADELGHAKNFDFAGLFRTEFLYMESDHLPAEQEQFKAYRNTLLAFSGKPVTLRTLDIGGDKTLPYMSLPCEENPFLGSRALRLCFQREDIFRTQLRAALRASVHGNLWIMFPMVGSMEDIRRAKDILHRVKRELDEEGTAYSREIKLGIMIEVPSIALLADKAAQEVDFASIGTNDLCQYLTAADRLDPAVSSYYQPYHPAMFRLIKTVADAFQKENKPVSVCGELGGDVLAAPVLVGLGIKKLSMNNRSAAEVKYTLAQHSMETLKQIAAQVLEMDSQESVLSCLKQNFQDRK